MTVNKPIRFAATSRDFYTTLNKRVHSYFSSEQINRHANTEMVIKTFVMYAVYLAPYLLIVTSTVTSTWALLGLAVLMGFGMSGIGLSVMHDANHGAYSAKPWLNNIIGYSLNLLGANSFNWKIQHNVLHHSFTNVYHEDEDINNGGIIRLTPHSPWKPIHRFQHIYAWFIYGLMTLSWITIKDIKQIIKYQKSGLTGKQGANMNTEWTILISTKLVYAIYIFVIPFVFTALAWWQILIGILIMHYVAGFILAIIFQPAHVTPGTEFPEPNEDSCLENNWAVHQLLTTTNFGNKSRWFSWCVGGLNFQIEHHLFPNICHVHYRKIAAIAEKTAKEFGIPYHRTKTFIQALAGHARMLRQLGLQPQLG